MNIPTRMTVQQVIDALQEVEDKTKCVRVWNCKRGEVGIVVALDDSNYREAVYLDFQEGYI